MDWTSLWRIRRRTGLAAVAAVLGAVVTRVSLSQPSQTKPKAPTIDPKAAAIRGTVFVAQLVEGPSEGHSVEYLVRSLDPLEPQEIGKTVSTKDVEVAGLQWNQNYAIKARLVVAGVQSDWTPEVVRSSALPQVASIVGVQLPAFSSARLDWAASLPSNVAAPSGVSLEILRKRGSSTSSVSLRADLVGSLLESGHLSGDAYSVRLVSKTLSAQTGSAITSESSPFVSLSLVGLNTGSPVQVQVQRALAIGSF